MRRIVIAIAVVAACVSCESSEHRDARAKYNEGVAALEKGDFDAAEKLLVEARSTAGVDPELRFRAAYDLGMAYAAHSDRAKAGLAEHEASPTGDKPGDKGKPDLAQALSLEQSALSWFSDASRLRSDDANTKTNLAIVTARVQALSDELRKAEGTLEARLDQVIAQQRGVLEGSRDAWLAVKMAHGADPLAQQVPLSQLADRERGIVAEAGVIADLAADEIDSIGKKPDDKRSDQEKARVVQLKNLDLYLIEARNRIADARRKLQELAAEDGVSHADEALASLKRAREQLLDPIAVMREVAIDQSEVYDDTATSQKLSSETVGLAPKLPEVAGSAATRADKPTVMPAWLVPLAIAGRQAGLHERLDEVRARLQAGVDSLGKPPKDGDKPPDPQQQKLLERIGAALPSVGDALAAMDKAHGELVGHRLDGAKDAETQVLVALTKAIEQFSDLKQTIELAYQHQRELLGLLAPEAATQLDPKERGKRTRDNLVGNLARMSRIKELLADETAALDAKKPDADPKADPKQVEAAKQQLDQAKQQMARADQLRGEAEAALGQLDKALGANKDPLPPAKDADDKLNELRKLFFSVIEHLQELIRQQGETRDQTSATSADDEFARAPKLPALITRETEHGTMAKAITDALAKQADEAGKQPQAPQGQGGPDAKSLAAAADEVRQAQTEMSSAQHVIEKARDSKTATQSLKPSVTSQGKAIEHLEEALKLLQPPKQGDDKDQKPKDNKDQKPQPQQGGAGQRARDEDAQRQRDRKNNHSDEPVDKDW